MSSTASTSAPTASVYLFDLFYLGVLLYAIAVLAYTAYRIRLHAIHEYGTVIHEFDPWFNFRATQYLHEHGWKKFFRWFDYMVWYPLGRPVGTTIYPGMQFTAVAINNYIMRGRMSLNDICCYMPAWFGALASSLTGLMAYECSREDNASTTIVSVTGNLLNPPPQTTHTGRSRSRRRSSQAKAKSQSQSRQGTYYTYTHSPAAEVGVASMAIMSILPAHIMRSVGGGYDNESVAISAMTVTFYLWCRSLRSSDDTSHRYGILTGIAYFYMASSWGGYVFVLNMIGTHAAVLLVMGRYSTKVYWSYSLFYLVGTMLAIQIPVVGWTPLKSLEQLGPAVVFVVYQLRFLSEYLSEKRKLNEKQRWKLRLKTLVIASVLAFVLVYCLAPAGYFGPLSSRVRGLFVKHTKTGNPLVDSVAEHQPASKAAYFQFLHCVCYVAPLGFLMLMWNFGDAPSFLMVYGVAAYFFSFKMVRLIILLGPIASALGGVCVGRLFAWCLKQFVPFLDYASGDGGASGADRRFVVRVAGDVDVGYSNTPSTDESSSNSGDAPATVGSRVPVTPTNGASKRKKRKEAASAHGRRQSGTTKQLGFAPLVDAVETASDTHEGRLIKKVIGGAILVIMTLTARAFTAYCWQMSHALSNPSIIVKARTRDGQTVVINDYLEAYHWLKDNTPEDSRILAWWDYGYQITGIANRTTIADGNTWNHEHIALLGKILTTNVSEGYDIARHLADYVLIWGGGGGDDLAKSPHLARIANSVYRDHCPKDPTCRAFGFVEQARAGGGGAGAPSKMMEESFLYQLHSNKIRPGVMADPDKFEEVFTSTYGRVRIYRIVGVSKESKDWVANPANRVCDVEGGWFCRGQYPPALQKYLHTKRDFAQLEDFNKGSGGGDEEYQKKYFDHLNNPDKAKAEALKQERELGTPKQGAAATRKAPKYDRAKVQEYAKLCGVSQRMDGTETEMLKTQAVIEDMVDYMKNEVLKEPDDPEKDFFSAKIRKSCRNEHNLCAFWAGTGHCKSNPWMTFHCAPACKACHLMDQESGYFKDIKEKMSRYGVLQRVEGNEDEKHKTHTSILEMIHYMQNEVFAVDFNDKFSPEMRQKCRNHHDLCAFWSATGNCENSRDYMERMCSPMCKTCHLVADLISDACVQCQQKGQQRFPTS